MLLREQGCLRTIKKEEEIKIRQYGRARTLDFASLFAAHAFYFTLALYEYDDGPRLSA